MVGASGAVCASAVADGGAGGATGAGGTGAGGAGGADAGTGGAGGGTVLFFEDFETGAAARWTPSVATDWTVVPDGSLVYKEGTATSDDTWRTSAAGDPTWTDVEVEARVKWLPSATTLPLVAICARYQGPTDFYWAGIGAASSVPGSVYIRRRTGTTSVRLIEMAANVTSGVWYTIKLRIVGSTLTLFVDGVQMLTVQDTMNPPAAYAAGKIGVASYDAAAEFDDVRVTSFP